MFAQDTQTQPLGSRFYGYPASGTPAPQTPPQVGSKLSRPHRSWGGFGHPSVQPRQKPGFHRRQSLLFSGDSYGPVKPRGSPIPGIIAFLLTLLAGCGFLTMKVFPWLGQLLHLGPGAQHSLTHQETHSTALSATYQLKFNSDLTELIQSTVLTVNQGVSQPIYPDDLALIILAESLGDASQFNPQIQMGGLIPYVTQTPSPQATQEQQMAIIQERLLSIRERLNGKLPQDPVVLYAMVLNPELAGTPNITDSTPLFSNTATAPSIYAGLTIGGLRDYVQVVEARYLNDLLADTVEALPPASNNNGTTNSVVEPAVPSAELPDTQQDWRSLAPGVYQLLDQGITNVGATGFSLSADALPPQYQLQSSLTRDHLRIPLTFEDCCRITQGPNPLHYPYWSMDIGRIDLNQTIHQNPHPILAAGPGVAVVFPYWDGGYGYHVGVYHGNNLFTLYAHMSEIHVQTGDIVEAGQELGLMGNTGHSSGPHLHFEVRTLDPNQLKNDVVRQKEAQGTATTWTYIGDGWGTNQDPSPVFEQPGWNVFDHQW